jgi:PAS domain S-box-containing protein
MKCQEEFRSVVEVSIREVSSDHPLTQTRSWMELGEFMSREVVTVSSDESLVSTAQMMSRRNVSCVVVVDNNDITGIVTETDLLRRGVAGEVNFNKLTVADIMSSPVECVSPNLSVLEAGRIMDARDIRRLPVAEDGRLVGIVTQTDVIRVLTSYGTWWGISEIMSRNVCSIDADADIEQAAKLMAERDISSIPVTEDGRVVGIFTERDMLKRVIALQRSPQNTTMRDVMSSPIVGIGTECSVHSAGRIMEKNKIRRLVVMDGAELKGIISQTDIFMAVKNRLAEDEESHLKLLEKSDSCIFTLDLSGMITYANPALLRLLEVSDPHEIIGMEFLPERFWWNPDEGLLFIKTQENYGPVMKELTLRSAAGRKIYATFYAGPIKAAHGRVDGSQGILYDITDQKELVALRQAQEALKRSKMEVEQVNRRLEWSAQEARNMAEQAIAASHAKSTFLANMSHEIRTPMNSIIGFGDILADENLSDEQKEYVNAIRNSGNHLMSLINDILDFSRIEAGKLEVHPAECSVRQVLEEVDQLLHPLASAKGLKFRVIESEFLPSSIYTDPSRLKQCLINLANNAIKFTETGHVFIRVSVECDQPTLPSVRFDVEDTGIGIEAEKQQKVFESFAQVDNSDTRKHQGTGLGLTITRQLAQLLGGSVTLSSKPGEGSTFTLKIPACPGPDSGKSPLMPAATGLPVR